MLQALIAWSLRNMVLVLVLAAGITAAGGYALLHTPVDALPDLSDVQVIVYTEYGGQAPQVVEDQLTFPLSSALLAVPRARVVRGFSFFGASFVYVIFEEGTDVYWARSRVLEYLDTARGRLPEGVTPTLGPDATGVGWVYQYALSSRAHDLGELRTLQDWYLRYQLTQTPGIAEVAGIGGFVKQYQVSIDPHRMHAFGIDAGTIRSAIRAGNRDVGGRVIEMAEREYMIRGKGYLRGRRDLEDIVLRSAGGVAVRLGDVARVELVPEERRGIAELDGEGETVGGIAVARHGGDALAVIDALKQRIAEITPGLPDGVDIRTVYDRSQLIREAIATLRTTLLEESVIVALVCALFLLHLPSALVAILMLPVAVLMAFLAMRLAGVGSNIMSLGGIAIAIGAMVDAAIVMIENAHRHIERDAGQRPRAQLILAACRETGPALFFSLLIVTVSFLPVFALEAQEGRLFHPLAFTKTFAMAAAALLSVTLVPVLMLLFVRGRILPEQRNPVNRALVAAYRPLIAAVLRHRWATLGCALAVLVATALPASRIGSEFMPTLNEGTLLYMPTTPPGLGVTAAAELLQRQDAIIRSFPEVATVFGKAGRAATATDPAPLEMFETIITLKPPAEWRAGLTMDRLIDELDAALRFPGVANAWTMPIKGRIDMLSTGIRTPVGIKVFGSELAELERVAREIEAVVRELPGTGSVYAERLTGGHYLNIEPDRERLGRYGLSIDDVQQTIASALGGETVTTTVEGRERYAVGVRYPRELRADPDAIARHVLVPAPDGAMIPLGQLATLRIEPGPPAIRTENALLSAYVFVDVRERDLGGYVERAQRAVADRVNFPPGYYATWSGQFEYMQRAAAKLRVVVPVTLALIFLLLYLNFRRAGEALIVMLSVPFALVGGVWLVWALDYQLSVAVAIGFIALAGVAAETGVVMLFYLDQAWEAACARSAQAARRPALADLYEAIMEGAAGRVRPKIMTVVAITAGLLPIMWSSGTGSEVMRRIAAPMVGGMLSSTLLTLAVIPAVYAIVHGRGLRRTAAQRGEDSAA
ncbi:MAG: Cation efflux system protein CusA [Pseudomonadales bacterium]|nr:Cation efflux system protein CusA [Pseudomonadales bacterium]